MKDKKNVSNIDLNTTKKKNVFALENQQTFYTIEIIFLFNLHNLRTPNNTK